MEGWVQKIVKSKRIFDKVSQGSLPFFDDRKGEREGEKAAEKAAWRLAMA
jgi:hypothetical protein